MRRFVALLRGINVGGRNQIGMADLCELAAGLGWSDIRTYVQSGNMVFGADGDPPKLERELELRLEQGFGLKVAVIVRPAESWSDIVRGNPFRQAAEADPSRLLLYLSKLPQQPGAEAALRERAEGGEAVAVVDEALWIHFPHGLARSKLVPVLVDRLLGSQSTGRNWRTVLKIQALLQQ
jgi:uncharacterized protein (DUF1697 family)